MVLIYGINPGTASLLPDLIGSGRTGQKKPKDAVQCILRLLSLCRFPVLYGHGLYLSPDLCVRRMSSDEGSFSPEVVDAMAP